MAWNPSPKVAAARDIGKKFQHASWGRTKALCGETGRLAEIAHRAIEVNA